MTAVPPIFLSAVFLAATLISWLWGLTLGPVRSVKVILVTLADYRS